MVRKHEPDAAGSPAADLLRALARAAGERPVEPAHAAGLFLDEELFEDWNRVARAAGVSVLHFGAWLREAADAHVKAGRPVLLAPGHELFRKAAIAAGAGIITRRCGPYVFDPVSTSGAAADLTDLFFTGTRVDGDLAAVAKGVPSMLAALMKASYDDAAAVRKPRRVVVLGPYVRLTLDGDEGRLTACVRYFAEYGNEADDA